MSKRLRRARRARVVVIAASFCLLFFGPGAAVAASGEVRAEIAPAQGPVIHTGLRLGLGAAGSPQPNDAVGETTLLFGTAFSGNTQRLALTSAWEPLSFMRVRVEAGVARAEVSGFARGSDFSRELTFRQGTVDFFVGPEFFYRVGAFEIFGGAQLGPRIGFTATARDRRDNIDLDAPPLGIRNGNALVGVLEVGGAGWFGAFRVPIALRVANNLTYPRSTAPRFDAGEYLVEHIWSISGVIGVDFSLAHQAGREAY